jgi:hypothetical protein
MLLRRLTENLKKQNWSAAGLELFILTLGVFLGLQAENWNQERIERAAARQYMERLSEDFTSIRDRASRSVDVLIRQIEALSVLSELTKGDRTRKDEEYTDLIRIVVFYPIPPSRAASYIEILESNDLRLLNDRSLVDSLIRCDNFIQSSWFTHDVRKRMEFERGQTFSNLFLDTQDLSLPEALKRMDAGADSFRRELAMRRVLRLGEKENFGGILECSTEIVDRLTAGR